MAARPSNTTVHYQSCPVTPGGSDSASPSLPLSPEFSPFIMPMVPPSYHAISPSYTALVRHLPPPLSLADPGSAPPHEDMAGGGDEYDAGDEGSDTEGEAAGDNGDSSRDSSRDSSDDNTQDSDKRGARDGKRSSRSCGRALFGWCVRFLFRQGYYDRTEW